MLLPLQEAIRVDEMKMISPVTHEPSRDFYAKEERHTT
jgi:hypothetical protein